MRKSLWLVFAGVLLFVLSACTSDDSVEVSEETGGDSSKTGDVIVGFDQDLSTIDPHGTNDVIGIQVRRHLYQTLVAREIDMTQKPGLATEWEQVDDLTWNFKLAEDVTFHNGSDFTADDVKASLERVQDPSISAPTVFLFDMIEEIEVVNDYELNITTAYPFAPLPDNLAHTAASIMSKESIDADYQNAIDQTDLGISVEEYYELRDAGGSEFEEVSEQVAPHTSTYLSEHPDGTNYVKFKAREPGQSIEFERFEEFTGKSNIDNLKFMIVPESGSMMAELESGGINVTTPVDMAMMERVQGSESTEFVEADSLRTNYLGFNNQKEPFNDLKVRQAIDYALDREALKEGIYNGQAVIPNSMVSSKVFGYDEELPEVTQDMDKAKEAMAESNYPDGFDASIFVNESQDLVDSAVYIQEALKELNINIEVEQFEMATFMERLGQGQHDMFLLSFTASTGDADYLLSSLMLSTNEGFGGNRAFYNNETLDAALETARSATEDEARLEEYTKIHNMIREDVPYSPLVHPNMSLAYNSEQLEGVELDAAGYIRLENLEFK